MVLMQAFCNTRSDVHMEKTTGDSVDMSVIILLTLVIYYYSRQLFNFMTQVTLCYLPSVFIRLWSQTLFTVIEH